MAVKMVCIAKQREALRLYPVHNMMMAKRNVAFHSISTIRCLLNQTTQRNILNLVVCTLRIFSSRICNAAQDQLQCWNLACDGITTASAV